MSESFVRLPNDLPRGLSVVGEKITVLASGEQANGYELFLQGGPAGTGPPPHFHDWDESFYVLNGKVAFGVDGSDMVADPGTLVHIAAGSVHWFRFESDGGRMLSITGNGSGAAAFFTQVDADVAVATDIPALAGVAQKHNVVFA